MRVIDNSYLTSKGLWHRQPIQMSFEEIRLELKAGIDQFIERISNDKSITKNPFLD